MDISICLKYIEVEPLIYDMTLTSPEYKKKSDSQSCRNPPPPTHNYKSSKTLYFSVNKHTVNERVP